MKSLSTFRSLSIVLVLCASLEARAATPGEEMAAAANKLAATLTPEQKAKCLFEMKADARLGWHFIPSEMVKPQRYGLMLKEMTAEQRKLALALLATGLSQTGLNKATNIMSLEDVLHEMEKAKPVVERDPGKYFVSIYGTPGPKGAWSWRYEGHHLSVSFTIVDGHQFSFAPSFMGTNPADVRTGPRIGTRVLGKEEDFARQLVKSLDAAQKTVALYTNTAPKDIITGADHNVKPLAPEGLAVAKMTAVQSDVLRQVVDEYIHRARREMADSDWTKIKKAGWEKVHFAWAGGTERGEGHYYRVQGPTFLLEYDNTQNNANHVHAVWRDFNGDFGEDILKKHYDADHKTR